VIEQACILAGGLGTRLGELTKKTPKPLLPVAESPFLDYVLWNLKRHGMRRVVLSVGYLAAEFETVLGDGAQLGLNLSYVVEKEPLGTGGGLKLSADMLEEEFLVLNGDTIFDVNYLELALKLKGENLAAMALRQVDDASRYGRVELVSGQVVDFDEKSHFGPGLISCPKGAAPLSRICFPCWYSRGSLQARLSTAFFWILGLLKPTMRPKASFASGKDDRLLL